MRDYEFVIRPLKIYPKYHDPPMPLTPTPPMLKSLKWPNVKKAQNKSPLSS